MDGVSKSPGKKMKMESLEVRLVGCGDPRHELVMCDALFIDCSFILN